MSHSLSDAKVRDYVKVYLSLYYLQLEMNFWILHLWPLSGAVSALKHASRSLQGWCSTLASLKGMVRHLARLCLKDSGCRHYV